VPIQVARLAQHASTQAHERAATPPAAHIPGLQQEGGQEEAGAGGHMIGQTTALSQQPSRQCAATDTISKLPCSQNAGRRNSRKQCRFVTWQVQSNPRSASMQCLAAPAAHLDGVCCGCCHDLVRRHEQRLLLLVLVVRRGALATPRQLPGAGAHNGAGAAACERGRLYIGRALAVVHNVLRAADRGQLGTCCTMCPVARRVEGREGVQDSRGLLLLLAVLLLLRR
jgi:hypothetical protein